MSLGAGIGCGLAGRFWLQVTREVPVEDVGRGQLSSEGWGGAGRCGLKVVSQSWQASSGCQQETASLLMWACLSGSLGNLDGMKAGFP